MIVRLEVEVPKERNITVSDITIGGEPIRFGGQIAECITVKITGIAHIPSQPVRNVPVRCSGRGALDHRNPFSLVHLESGINPSRGRVGAFSSQGTDEGAVPRGQLPIRRLAIARHRAQRRKTI
jgi:hypothetical protein